MFLSADQIATHGCHSGIRGITRSTRAPTGAAWIALGVLILSIRTALSASPERLDFFEQRIRPTLVNECYECHGAKKQQGGLLNDRDSGPELIQSTRHEAPDSMMPKDRPQLPDSVIADFVTWVNQGAVDPRDQPPADSAADLRADQSSEGARPVRRNAHRLGG